MFPHWSQRTAYNYIGLHRFATRHGGRFANVANSIDLSAIYLLNAPSTPPEVFDQVVDRAGGGERITRETVQAAIEHHRPTKPKGAEQPARKAAAAPPPAPPGHSAVPSLDTRTNAPDPEWPTPEPIREAGAPSGPSAAASPKPPDPSVPEPTPNRTQWEEWLDKVPGDFLITYCAENATAEGMCKAFRKIGIAVTLGDEAEQLQERIRQLEEEKRKLEERIKAPATRDLAAEFGAMTPSERNAFMFKVVTDHLPTDHRARQEWSKDACGWIQNFYNKLAGPKENPWQWRQKVHRQIKLPAGIDAGKPSRDEIGDNPSTATEADMARQVAPPRPAPSKETLPKLSDAPDYRRFAPPGSLLKPDKPQGRRHNGGADNTDFD